MFLCKGVKPSRRLRTAQSTLSSAAIVNPSHVLSSSSALIWIVSPSSVSQINLSHFWRSGRIAITSTLTALQLRGFRAANIESFLRGAFPPVDREAVCFVRAMDWDIAKDLHGVRGTPGV